ncbi:MAG: PQQ-binding-like beta-propeller repeat protein [Bacteroidetes bacterium]|nr:PQQ-binding-like beta-propeller repeat protein [Bacteroidota bacterium]
MRFIILILSIIPLFTSVSAQTLHQRWSFTARGPFIGSAVAADGLIIAGSLDSTLYALDTADGSLRWTYRASAPIRSTPCSDGRTLYLNAGGSLIALNTKDGSVRWRFRTRGEKVYSPYAYADYYQSSPVFDGGTVYVGSGDGHVYAVRSSDGSLRWKFNTGDVVHATPAVDSSRIYIGSFNGIMYALQRNHGREVWRFKTVGHRFFPKGEVQGTAVVSNGLVMFGARDYNVYALDAAKGFAHWNRTFPKGWSLSHTANGSALFTGTSDDDLIVAFDAVTGTERWRTDVRFNTFGRGAVKDSLLIIGTLLGQVHVMDTRSGQIVQSFRTEGFRSGHARYFTHPDSISKERFYSIVQDPDGYIKGLYDLGAILSDILLLKDDIIVTSTDGKIYSLRR